MPLRYLLLLLLLVLPACTKPDTGTTTKPGDKTAPTKPEPPKVAFDGFSSKLFWEYKSNTAHAEKTYTDQPVRIRNEIKNINRADPPAIELRVPDPPGERRHVRCRLKSDQREAMAGLKRGDTVVLQGICKGMGGDDFLVVEDCEIVEKIPQKKALDD